MKKLVFVVVLAFCGFIVVQMAQVVAHTQTWGQAAALFRARITVGNQDLHAWKWLYLSAFMAGMIEGYLWRRQQVFAGFYQTLFGSTVLISFLMILVAMAHLLLVPPHYVALWGLAGLSFFLGLALLAGRPLMR